MKHQIYLSLAFLCVTAVQAQVPASLRAGFGLPPGQVPAPNNPAGAVVVGANLYTGDAAGGFRHWRPADPTNPDPVDTGLLVYDTDTSFSLGGNGLCLPFCQVGQMAFDGNQTVYLASYDHLRGNGATIPGIWRIDIDPATGNRTNNFPLVPNAGLAGNNPTSIALGPDGNLYVGFLKNGSIVRITNPTALPFDPVAAKTQVVQSVGTAPNGRPVRALAFAGPDLYLATTDGLAVIRNAIAPTCLGGCNGVAVADGFQGIAHVGITSDSINRLYVSINNSVWRYTISTNSMQLVSSGGSDPITGAPLSFLFVKGHTNLLQLDRLGNLWIGDDSSDGTFNFTGRLWYISAGALSNIP